MSEVRRAVAGWITTRMEWGAATLMAICLVAAVPLYALSAYRWALGELADARLGLVGATVWTAMAGYIALRRRLNTWDSGALIATATTVMVVEGIAFDDVNVRWMCAAALVVVPVATVMLLPASGTVFTTGVAIAGEVVISLTLPAPLLMRVYSALTMVAMVLVPISVVTVLIRRAQDARDLARTLAVTDPLTGLSNRRGIQARAGSIVEAAAGDPVTVMVLDLDHFKAVNDTYGHAVGDRVLIEVAGAMTRVARADDLLIRMGGEELGWVAHFPGPSEVARAAERLHAAVRDLSVAGLPPVTVSVGVASAAVTPGQDPVDAVLSLLGTADRALYDAKRAGRDRIAYAADRPRELSSTG